MINTTPHAVAVMGAGGKIVSYPSDRSSLIRAEMVDVKVAAAVDGCTVVRAGPYAVTSVPESVRKADAVIVSTIVATCARQIRELVGRPIRVLVPDSSPGMSQRDAKGQILYVERFLEY